MTPSPGSSTRAPARKRATGQRGIKRPGKKLLDHDRALGHRYVAGVDEAGRGCLAGPLVAAAVVLDMQRLVGPDASPLMQVNDSKQLSHAERERMYASVLTCVSSWSISVISPARIDRVGLHKCNIEAMKIALRGLRVTPEVGLVDGFALVEHNLAYPCTQIIKGDATSASIAAASIIAKVSRDRLMMRLDERLGGRWAFAEHMGYATPLHHERLQEHGPGSHHRMSFASAAYEGVARFVGTEQQARVPRFPRTSDEA